MITLNQKMEIEKNYVIWILIVLLFIFFTENFFEDIAGDVERWFDTSNYDENDKRPLPIGKNEKVPGLFNDELEGKIMIEFCVLRPKMNAYLIDSYNDDDYEKKRCKQKP